MSAGSIKWFFFSLISTAISAQSFSQNSAHSNYFLKAIRLNTGFTHWDHGSEEFVNFHEVTWSNQVSVSITHDLYIGLQLYSLYTWGSYVSDENFLLKGVFIHYDFIPHEKAMGFVELSYMQGDYCYCGPGDPYRFPNLHYIGVGPGLDYPILKSNFFAHASVLAHIIAGSAEDKYPYIIYKFGLSYRIGKPRYAALP